MKKLCAKCSNEPFENGYVTPRTDERVFILCLDHFGEA